MKRVFGAVGVLGLLFTACLLAQSGPFTPSAAVTLQINPASPSMGQDITVDVYVNLTGVANGGGASAALGGFVVPIAFDNKRMTLKTVVKGSSSAFTGDLTYTTLSRANARGFVSVVNAQTGSGTPTGNVHVATLTFGLTEAGKILLDVNSARADHEGSLASTYMATGGGPALIGYADQLTNLTAAKGSNLYHLIFPTFINSAAASVFQGMTLVNEGAAASDLTATAYQPNGSLVAIPGGANPNPGLAPLSPLNQFVKGAPSFFGVNDVSNQQGWIDVACSEHNVSGFFLLYGIQGGVISEMDGSDVSHVLASRLILPVLWKEAGRPTSINVVNPGATDASGTLKLMKSDGTVANTSAITIPARGSYEASFDSTVMAGDGYFDIAMTSGQVTGLERFGNAQSLAMVAGQDANMASNILVAPHATSGNFTAIRYYTNLSVVNPGTLTANVTLRLLNDAGVEQAAAVTRTIAAGNQLKTGLHQLFGLDDPTTATGSVSGVVKIESDQGLVGCVTFGDPVTGKILASLPLMSTASAKRELYLDHLAMGTISGLNFYTGLAMFNPSKERTANVTVAMYFLDPADSTWKQRATTTKVLAPQNRWVNVVNQLAPSFDVTQSGGFLKITSDVEIYAFQLFGDYNFNYLSAVPVR